MKEKKKYEAFQTDFDELSNKYEAAIKEKMLMKLEKDRLIAKVENLDLSLKQLIEEQEGDKQIDAVGSPSKEKTQVSQQNISAS